MPGFIRKFVLFALAVAVMTSGACQKSKSDKGADILEDMMDIWVSTVDDFFDIVDDNYDICNKCKDDTDRLVEQRRGQMNTLYTQWKNLSSQMSTKEKLDAIEETRSTYEDSWKKIDAMQQDNIETFREFDKNCASSTEQVYQKMLEARNLFPSFMEAEY